MPRPNYRAQSPRDGAQVRWGGFDNDFDQTGRRARYCLAKPGRRAIMDWVHGGVETINAPHWLWYACALFVWVPNA